MDSTELRWSDSVDCWTATVVTPLVSDASLYVATSGEHDPPTALQRRALAQIHQLQPSLRAEIDRLLHEWVTSTWEPDAQEDLEDDDFEWEIDAFQIPPIVDLDDTYFMIHLRCELEPEHGVGLACRNGVDFAICHPETFQGLDIDDQASLDSAFAPRAS